MLRGMKDHDDVLGPGRFAALQAEVAGYSYGELIVRTRALTLELQLIDAVQAEIVAEFRRRGRPLPATGRGPNGRLGA